MNYLICNIFISNSSSIESFIDQKVVKELAFSSKIKKQLPGKKKDLTYNTILVPILEKPQKLSTEMVLLQEGLFTKTHSLVTVTEDMMYSIAKIFEEGNRMVLTSEKLLLEITVLAEIPYTDFDILYSDGSFKKATSEASYGTVKLLEEVVVNNIPQGQGYPVAPVYGTTELDHFTGKHYTYQGFSGIVQEGTNNIGELSGLKAAIENFGDKKYQLIISDSEYSIKVFREWYYTWKNSNFKNYAKKEIKNKELIQEIAKLAKESGKTILFKWTKGHDKNPFNELCDVLAKGALGI